MIPAQSLRIGNLVLLNNPSAWSELVGKIMRVTAIEKCSDRLFPLSDGSVKLKDIDGKSDYAQFNEFIEPIPLTSDILIRLGFEKDTNWYFKDWVVSEKSGKFELNKWRPAYDKKDRGAEIWQFIRMVEHVHVLQNAMYFIDGTELTLDNHKPTN